MALEVNEIGIRMRIFGDGNQEPPPPDEADETAVQRRDELIDACVRQVLRVLKAMEER